MNVNAPMVKHQDTMGYAVYCGDVRITCWYRTEALAEKALRVILEKAKESDIRWKEVVYNGEAEERRAKEFIKKLSKQYNVQHIHYDREIVYNRAMAVGMATKGAR